MTAAINLAPISAIFAENNSITTSCDVKAVAVSLNFWVCGVASPATVFKPNITIGFN